MTEYKPAIPAKLRTAVYFTGLGCGFAAMLGTGLSAIWFPALAGQVAQTGTAVTAAVGWLASALGVAYRPTAQQNPEPAPAESESDAL